MRWWIINWEMVYLLLRGLELIFDLSNDYYDFHDINWYQENPLWILNTHLMDVVDRLAFPRRESVCFYPTTYHQSSGLVKLDVNVVRWDQKSSLAILKIISPKRDSPSPNGSNWIGTDAHCMFVSSSRSPVSGDPLDDVRPVLAGLLWFCVITSLERTHTPHLMMNSGGV